MKRLLTIAKWVAAVIHTALALPIIALAITSGWKLVLGAASCLTRSQSFLGDALWTGLYILSLPAGIVIVIVGLWAGASAISWWRPNAWNSVTRRPS